MCECITFEELSKKRKIANLLIGNGFVLSHPELKNVFQWDLREALCGDWQNILDFDSEKCPEKDLSKIRDRILRRILLYYINGLHKEFLTRGSTVHPKDKINLGAIYQGYKEKQKFSAQNFLKDREKIFTLNYDPIFYFEILKLLESTNEIRDGFNGEKWIDAEKLLRRLGSCPRKVFYLHGSWFIEQRANGELRKLSFSRDAVEIKLEEYFPYLVLEDRNQVKKMLLENKKEHPYLNFCYEQLKQIQGNLLVFGVSFKNDEHILEALNSAEELEHIYITCFKEEDTLHLNKCLENHGRLKKPYTCVLIREHQIWE